MIRRTLFFSILSLVLLAGCAGPGESSPAPAETKSPDFSTVETRTATTQALATATPVMAETPTETITATQAPSATIVATTTPEDSSLPGWIAYIAPDGNLTLLNRSNGESQPVTSDAAPPQPGQNSAQIEVTYSSPKWSSDGNRLAYMKQVGTPVETGYDYELSLVVYDLVSEQSSELVTGQLITGFDWRPGSNLIAYGLPIDQDYFMNQNPNLATGINGVQADTGEITKLVEPERGFPLVSPRWSPDGRFLAFEEVQYMEGRGLFSLYDFEDQEYRPWEQVIGNYSWSPDSQSLAFDRLAYIPSGEERIYLSDLQGDNPQPLSPEIEQGYAFAPAFSPQGDRLAYLAEVGDPASSQYKLFLIPVSGGDPQELGIFEQPQELSWYPDGERLLLTSGPFDARQILVVSALDGFTQVLTEGSQPALQPIVQ